MKHQIYQKISVRNNYTIIQDIKGGEYVMLNVVYDIRLPL